MFPRIDYVDWVLPRIESASYDLGSSDLQPSGDGDGPVPSRLADRDPAPESVEALLASAYDVAPEQVVVTAGASAADLVAAATALDLNAPEEGTGRVLVEKPGYEPHVATPRGFGATVDRFVRTADDDWLLDPDRIRAAAMPETALVTVTNRHNPTGTRTGRETLAECATAAREDGAGAHLLVDEVYAPYGPETGGPGVGGPTVADVDGAVATGSLTKFWGFGSLRIGWLIADEQFARRAREVSVHLADVAGPSRELARRALGASEELNERSSRRCRLNHDLLRSFVEERDDLSGRVPAGSPFAFLTHERSDGDALAEAAWERDLLVIPGRFFEAPESVRVSLGRSPTRSEEALEVFGDVLDDL